MRSSGDRSPIAGEFHSSGNLLQLLVRGDHTREAMLAAIDRAERRVWLETFILMPDRVGRQFIDALARAAKRCVQVILIADQKGSALFSLGFHRRLLAAGAKVYLYNPLLPWRHLGREVGRTRDRDHRKILIADEVAFCGGHNLATAYLGSQKPEHFDVTLMARGPVVADLGRVFLQTLEQTGDIRPAPLMPPPAIPGGSEAAVQIMDRRKDLEASDEAMSDLLRNARSRCYLMIAYLLPEEWLIDELQNAASRGVDVRITLAGETDFPPIRAAVRHLYSSLIPHGIRIFEMQDQKLHAKVAVADGAQVLVGTYDYNRFSAAFSLETTVTSSDPDLAAEVEELILANAERSREMTASDLDRWNGVTRTAHRFALGVLDFAATRGL